MPSSLRWIAVDVQTARCEVILHGKGPPGPRAYPSALTGCRVRGQSESTCACCCMSHFPASPPLYLSFNSSESLAVPELVLFGNHSQLGRVRPGCAVQASRGLSVCGVKSLEYSLIWANWICVVVICHWLKGSLSAKCWCKKTGLACNVPIHFALSRKALQAN